MAAPFLLAMNVIVLIGFLVALVGIATTSASRGFITPATRFIIAGGMAIWVFIGVSHVLQYSVGSMVLDVYENYIKVLFLPLMAYAAYATNVNEQLLETERHAHVLAAEHGMLMRVVDTAPTALLVIDDAGRIEFANERAREVLELEEDPETGRFRTPAWVCEGPTCKHVPAAFSCCLEARPQRDALCSICWPDGRFSRVLLSATPIEASDGTISGAVVAFADAADVTDAAAG